MSSQMRRWWWQWWQYAGGGVLRWWGVVNKILEDCPCKSKDCNLYFFIFKPLESIIYHRNDLVLRIAAHEGHHRIVEALLEREKPPFQRHLHQHHRQHHQQHQHQLFRFCTFFITFITAQGFSRKERLGLDVVRCGTYPWLAAKKNQPQVILLQPPFFLENWWQIWAHIWAHEPTLTLFSKMLYSVSPNITITILYDQQWNPRCWSFCWRQAMVQKDSGRTAMGFGIGPSWLIAI